MATPATLKFPALFFRQAEKATPTTRTARQPGRAVPVDLCLALTSADLTTSRKGKRGAPGASIAVSPSGQTLALGAQAAAMDGRVPPHIRVLQPLAGGRVVDFPLAVRIFEHALKTAGASGPVGPRALLSVPQALTESERRSLTEAARSAGVRKAHLIAHSLTAAVGAGLPVLEAKGSLIVDLDATSAEGSLISYGRILHNRPLSASRQQFQEVLAQSLRRQKHVQICLGTAETLLQKLGSAEPIDSARERAVGGRDLAEGLPRKLTVTAAEVHEAIAPLLAALVSDLRKLIGELSTELLGDVMERGLVLTGPGTRLDGLAGFLSRHLKVPVRLAEDAPEAGARGLGILQDQASLRGALLGQTRSERRRLSPARSLALGVLMLGLLLVMVPLLSGKATAVDSTLSSTMSPLWRMAAPHPPAEVAPVAMEERRRRAQVEAENRRLRGLVKLRSQPPFASRATHTARVIARDPQGWLNTLTVDAGSHEGLKAGLPVVTADGLLGLVASLQPASAQVRLLTNSRSAVAARVVGRKASGVLYGKGESLLELRFLDPEARVRKGDLVVTSGLDSKFPPGLRLGRVSQVKSVQDATYSTVLVQPSATPDANEVVVLSR